MKSHTSAQWLFTSVFTASSAFAQGSFGTECTNIRFVEQWLIGSCPTGRGDSRIDSSVHLGTIISNNDAKLQWESSGGGGYSATCSDCKLSRSTLGCTCRAAQGGARSTELNLEEHIANYEGHLLYNLTGPVEIPEDSPIPIPSDFSWNLQTGETSCYSTDEQFNCDTPPVANPGPCPTSGAGWAGRTPVRCATFRWPVFVPSWSTFQSLDPVSPENAWEFSVYDNTDCSGKPQKVIAPGEANQCYKFSFKALGVAVRPGWNAD